MRRYRCGWTTRKSSPSKVSPPSSRCRTRSERVVRADIDATGRWRARLARWLRCGFRRPPRRRTRRGRRRSTPGKSRQRRMPTGLAPAGGSARKRRRAHRARLELSGHAAAGTLTISALRAEVAGSTLQASGTIKDGRFAGSAEISAPDLDRFSPFLSRPLAGAVAAARGGRREPVRLGRRPRRRGGRPRHEAWNGYRRSLAGGNRPAEGGHFPLGSGRSEGR